MSESFLKRSLSVVLLALVLTAGTALVPIRAWSDVKIDAKHFPDEKFRQWVKEEVAKGGDVLTDKQAAAVKELDVSFYGLYDISSLKGIEYFTALTSLRCDGNPIKTLDLSKNKALEWLRCSGLGLTELNLSGVPALKTLDCSQNKLTKLNLSGNSKLEILNCGSNQLTKLDLSDTPALSNIDCPDNKLTELNLSNTPALIHLNCGINKLTELDLSGSPALRALSCYDTGLMDLDLSGVPKLENLNCSGNKLTKLDLSRNPSLYALDCSSNKLKELDLSNQSALEWLYCGDTALARLDLLKKSKLQEVTLPDAAAVTLPNGDKIDAEDFLVKKTKGGKWRLDLSRYTGKVQVSAYNRGVVEDTSVPVDVSGGVYSFDSCDGSISVFYKLGGEDSWLQLHLAAPKDNAPVVDDGEPRKAERPESGGDEEEPCEEPIEEVRNLSVTLVNKTDANIFVALAGWPDSGEDAGSFTRGWYKVEPRKGRTVTYSNVNLSFGFGFYAKSGSRLVWTAKPGDSRYAGRFWIHPQNAFKSFDGKPVKGGKQVNFRTLMVSEDGKATINFSVKK
ncbi:MAG: hypothetical protein K6E38_03150 [Fretibacterium sp.]|nr:hypothetical protein [Fretibacterium sp.]